MVECLVGAGATLTTSNVDGEGPLQVAAVRGHCECVRVVCEGGAVLDHVDKVRVCGCGAHHI